MLKQLLDKLISKETRARWGTLYISYIRNTRHSTWPNIGKSVELNAPIMADPHFVTLGDYVRLQPGLRIISSGGNVEIKKFSAIGAETTIIPGGHTPTVNLPQILSTLHINDTQSSIIIGEDCWVGARCILLSHCTIGRGAIVGSGSVVTKAVPSYAVVAGNPARILAARFNKEQILAHERSLYEPKERMTESELDNLFTEYYENKRTIGTSDMSVQDAALLASVKQERGIADYGEQQ